MSKITEALERIGKTAHMKTPSLPHVARYIETGDESALKAISKSQNQYTYWAHELWRAARPVGAWAEEDRRVVRVVARAAGFESLLHWAINQETDDGGQQDVLKALTEVCPVDDKELTTASLACTYSYMDRQTHVPTSIGRYLLTRSADELRAAAKGVPQGFDGREELAALLARHAPDTAESLLDLLLGKPRYGSPADAAEELLKGNVDRFEPAVAALFEQQKSVETKFDVGVHLHAARPGKYDAAVLEAARLVLKKPADEANRQTALRWMVKHVGEPVLPEVIEHFRTMKEPSGYDDDVLNEATEALGPKAEPLAVALLERVFDHAKIAAAQTHWYRTLPYRCDGKVRRLAISKLLSLDADRHAPMIEEQIRRGMGWNDPDESIAFLKLAGQWQPERFEADVWGLLEHKSKQVRSTAARTLSKVGAAVVPKAKDLLRHKKADARSAAVMLLVNIGSDASLAELEARLDDEQNDDVRDQMLLGLSAAWEKQGRKPTRADVEKRIKKTAPKLAEPLAKWAEPAKLPALYWTDGKKLSSEAVAYLLYRQSRAKEIKPDVEAAPMYGLIDRERSAEFGRVVLAGFLGSKQEASDKWALTIAGLLGDDGIVPDLVKQIREWAEKSRGKLAEYAVQALALMNSDTALLAVDAMAIKYRSKMKNIGKAAAEAFNAAAEQLGVTPDELGDRVVPWLGFEPGKPRVVEAGKSRIEATIGLDLKLAFKDLDKGKPVKSLPASAGKGVVAEFKDLSANLREISKAQMLRLENLLVRQRRWPAARWKELFLRHPLLLPFAVRLVWGHYDDAGKRLGTFRALEDRSLTTNADDTYELPDTGQVSMLHPLELDEAELSAWRNHVADYEIDPPFPQLEREVVHVTDEQRRQRVHKALAGTSINGMTFKGRAERLGWYRGGVADAGSITSYYKSFPAAGVDVFLLVENMFIGMDMYEDITLGEVYFAQGGSVKIGSYIYDEPGKEDDPRVVALGDVPPIVFSEVMGDLKKIAPKKDDAEASAAEAAAAV